MKSRQGQKAQFYASDEKKSKAHNDEGYTMPENVKVKDLNSDDVLKLFEESIGKSDYYDVYVRLSPKSKREVDLQNERNLKSSGNGTIRNSKREIKRLDILDFIARVNDLILKLDTKFKMDKKSSAAINDVSNMSEKVSLEVKSLRKRTIEYVLEGEEYQKMIYKTNDLHRNCSKSQQDKFARYNATSEKNKIKNDCTCMASFVTPMNLKNAQQTLRNKLLRTPILGYSVPLNQSNDVAVPNSTTSTMKKSTNTKKRPKTKNEKEELKKSSVNISKKLSKEKQGQRPNEHQMSDYDNKDFDQRHFQDEDYMNYIRSQKSPMQNNYRQDDRRNSQEVQDMNKKLDQILENINYYEDPEFDVDTFRQSLKETPQVTADTTMNKDVTARSPNNMGGRKSNRSSTPIKDVQITPGKRNNEQDVHIEFGEHRNSNIKNSSNREGKYHENVKSSEKKTRPVMKSEKVVKNNNQKFRPIDPLESTEFGYKNTALIYPQSKFINEEDLDLYMDTNLAQNNTESPTKSNRFNLKEEDLQNYQGILRREGKKRRDRTEKLRNRIKEIRGYLRKLVAKENETMGYGDIKQDEKLTSIKSVIRETLQCFYHLKMIFQSSECFDEEITDAIEGTEADLKGCINVCESMGIIIQENKSELLGGVHHIIQKHVEKILRVTNGQDEMINFEFKTDQIEKPKLPNQEFIRDYRKPVTQVGNKNFIQGEYGEFMVTNSPKKEQADFYNKPIAFSGEKNLIEGQYGQNAYTDPHKGNYEQNVMENSQRIYGLNKETNFNEPDSYKVNLNNVEQIRFPIDQPPTGMYEAKDFTESFNNKLDIEPYKQSMQQNTISPKPSEKTSDQNFSPIRNKESPSLSTQNNDNIIQFTANDFNRQFYEKEHPTSPIDQFQPKDDSNKDFREFGRDFLIDKTMDSNNSFLPGTLIARTKLKVPIKKNPEQNLNLSATVIKQIDSKIFAVGFTDGSIGFYQIANFELIATIIRHKSAITSQETMMTKDGNKYQISGCSEEESSIIIWDIKKGFKPIKRLKGHDNMISCIRDLGDNSTIATSAFDGKIVLWDIMNNFQCVQILDDNKGPVTCLDYSFKDNLLISGSIDGYIIVYKIHFSNDVYSGCELMNKFCTFGHVMELARCFRKPELMVSQESDFIMRLYNIEKKEVVAQIAHEGPIIDFLIVESEKDQEPQIFAMDNRNNLMKFDLENSIRIRNKVEKKEIGYSRFLGYGPKSQVIVKDNKVFLLSLSQINCEVSLFKLVTST